MVVQALGYVGIEAGLWFPNDTELDFDVTGDYQYSYDVDFEHKMGFDGDIIGGYDFGQFRAEAELAYKTAGIDDVTVDFGGGDIDEFDGDGDLSVWSIMGNLLWNPSMGGNWDLYLGGGAGWAWTKIDDNDDEAKDNAFAWQLIAGVGYNLSDNVTLGLKYRYFQTKIRDDEEGVEIDATLGGDRAE